MNSSGSSTYKFMDPNTVGSDAYAANMLLYARAVARKFGSRIDAWQTENEPNYAWITAVADSRCSLLTGGEQCQPDQPRGGQYSVAAPELSRQIRGIDMSPADLQTAQLRV